MVWRFFVCLFVCCLFGLFLANLGFVELGVGCKQIKDGDNVHLAGREWMLWSKTVIDADNQGPSLVCGAASEVIVAFQRASNKSTAMQHHNGFPQFYMHVCL